MPSCRLKRGAIYARGVRHTRTYTRQTVWPWPYESCLDSSQSEWGSATKGGGGAKYAWGVATCSVRKQRLTVVEVAKCLFNKIATYV